MHVVIRRGLLALLLICVAACQPLPQPFRRQPGERPPAALLRGKDSRARVRPITTGISMIDRMGVMEIFWYSLQLRRIAEGGNPRPGESGLWAFLKSVMKSGWGTFRTRRLRASA